MIALRSLLIVLSTTTLVFATFSRHQNNNWAVSTWNEAPDEERADCSGRGGFYVKGQGGRQVCCSEKTRVPPRDTNCPREWSQHKRTGTCIPPVRSFWDSFPVIVADTVADRNLVLLATVAKDIAGTQKPGNSKRTSRRNVAVDNGQSRHPLCLDAQMLTSGYRWHKRSKSCLPDQADTPGKCPPGKSCPNGALQSFLNERGYIADTNLNQ